MYFKIELFCTNIFSRQRRQRHEQNSQESLLSFWWGMLSHWSVPGIEALNTHGALTTLDIWSSVTIQDNVSPAQVL